MPKLIDINGMTGVVGDGQVSLAWVKPPTGTNNTVYEYSFDSVTWLHLGKYSEVRHIEPYSMFYVAHISNLTNDQTYRIYMRGVDYDADITGNESIPLGSDYSYIDLVPSTFKQGEPTPEKIMTNLPAFYNTTEGSYFYKFFRVLALHIRQYFKDLNEQGLPQLNILTASGEFIDNWGVLFNVPRAVIRSESGDEQENDADYAARIIRSFTIPKATTQALQDALQPYCSMEVVLIEGKNDRNKFYLHNGVSAGSFLGYKPYSGNNTNAYGTVFGSANTAGFVFKLQLKLKDDTPLNRLIVQKVIAKHKIAGVQFSIQYI